MNLKHHAEALAIETFSVVLGITLALGVNAWHDARTHAAEARQALIAIRAELAADDTVLRSKLPYHRAMQDSLNALVARTKGPQVVGGYQAIRNWNGLQPPRLLDDAWQTARSTQALQYMPYGAAIRLSRVYALQQRIDDVDHAFFAAVYTPAFASSGVVSIGASASYLGDLARAEQQMLSQGDSEVVRLSGLIGQP